ncbi:MAG: GWxTD domain-containing protein [Cyclobacteriaceae bacterium]
MAGITWLNVFYYLLSMVYPSALDHTQTKELGNQRHLYDSYAEIHCQFRSVTHDNTTIGHLKVLPRLTSFEPDDYYITYHTTKATGSKTESDTLTMSQRTSEGSFIATLEWSDLLGGSVYLLIQNIASGESWEYEWLIQDGDPLILKNGSGVPVFENYILQKDSFHIESADPSVSSVYVYQYRHDFEPARPPISSAPGASGKNLSIDSVWSVKVGQKILLEDLGLYFIQSDSSSLKGISFRITDNSYPKPGKIESLVAPLKYITTKSEYRRLQSADDPKKAFDKFWLEQTNDEQLARKNIKAYFQRFTWSNQVFTSYKEGWKTDRGMIFMIFGLPMDVRRLPAREEWTYSGFGDSQVVFTFMMVPNIFTDQHYELVRSSDYDDFWFATLDAWRTGGLTR